MATSTIHSTVGRPARRNTRHPVVELFGPTLQGEGPQQGRPAFFVRFGGCDFRCHWCDSMHAVEPAHVRADARRLDADDIIAELAALPAGPDLVVLSGGNPALHDLGTLVEGLQQARYEVAVETQGTRWRSWLGAVDCLVVSPKGPSSGMDSEQAREMLERFLDKARCTDVAAVLKVVVFGDADLDYARDLARQYGDLELYLSVGTDVGASENETIAQLLARLRWLSEAVAADVTLKRARVGAQQHVLTWGTRKGV